MKKILPFIITTVIFIFTSCKNCKLESDKTHQAAIPIVEALAKYAKTNGIPKSFDDIKNFPYKLEPCSKKPDILVCKVLKDGYYFNKDNQFYSVKIRWIPNKEQLSGFGIFVIHNTTACYYDIYFDKKLNNNYFKPACSLIGSCKGWGKQ